MAGPGQGPADPSMASGAAQSGSTPRPAWHGRHIARCFKLADSRLQQQTSEVPGRVGSAGAKTQAPFELAVAPLAALCPAPCCALTSGLQCTAWSPQACLLVSCALCSAFESVKVPAWGLCRRLGVGSSYRRARPLLWRLHRDVRRLSKHYTCPHLPPRQSAATAATAAAAAVASAASRLHSRRQGAAAMAANYWASPQA